MNSKVTPKQLADFLEIYIRCYRKEVDLLTGEPPDGAGYPRGLIPPTFLESNLIRAYLLEDGVVINDESQVSYTDSQGPELLSPVIQRSVDGETCLEIVVVQDTLQNFIFKMTLGIIKLTSEKDQKNIEFGRKGGIAKLTLSNPNVGKERYVSDLRWYTYVHPAGWDPRNAWLYTFHDVRYDLASVIFRPKEWIPGFPVMAMSTEDIWRVSETFGQIGLRIKQFYEDIDKFKGLLDAYPKAEKPFQDFLDEHPYLLDLYATAIIPHPFLRIPEIKRKEEENRKRGKRGRIPDFMIANPDNTYTLVEIERPDKQFLTANEPRPTAKLTEAVNQFSTWREIIRKYAGHFSEFPNIHHHDGWIIIGRDASKAFSDPQEFRSELNRINDLYKDVKIMTFDELVERATMALHKLMSLSI